MSFLTFTVRSAKPNVGDALDHVIDKVMEDVVREARASMERAKHGRPYPPPGYRASAPGEAPGIRTGQLYASITSFRTPSGGVVQASTDYAGYLEYGTMHMEPRPFMGPAARKATRNKRRYELQFKREVEGDAL